MDAKQSRNYLLRVFYKIYIFVIRSEFQSISCLIREVSVWCLVLVAF